ncbi:hypothetical protein LCGC14_0355370 [marine sediment metagenome]|uniref:Uncharacterized protein n=1 Tax=marine sediment metagenome TaxID=412755 RepID=A0A0F9TSP2_9ZZZZ
MGNPFRDEEQFKAWRSRSRAYERFLRDWRDNLKEQWAEGVDVGAYEQKMAQALGDLADLTWEDVTRLYEEPEKETDEENEEGSSSP